MVEHVHKTYSCDRCGSDLGKAPPRSKLTAQAHKEGEWAMEFSFTWKDFCPRCEKDVSTFFTTRPTRQSGGSDV